MQFLRLIVVLIIVVIAVSGTYFAVTWHNQRKNMINQASEILKSLCPKPDRVHGAAKCYVDKMLGEYGWEHTRRLLDGSAKPTVFESAWMLGESKACIADKCS